LACVLCAEEVKIDFKETRYIDALNEKVTRDGWISFSDNSTKIHYGDREIMLINSHVTIKNADENVQVNAREEQNIINMFAALRAIFENSEERLKTFFKITEKSQDETTLEAINSSNPISILTYKVKNGNVTKLEIFSQNGDRITIDVVEKR
jgi:hypothetical protein